MQRTIRVSTGIALTALGILGTVYSVQVARSQRIYHAVKYGSLSEAPPAVVADACEAAFTLYPHNYYLSIEATDRLWPGRDAAPSERTAGLAQVESWCERGLAQNPYRRKLRRTKTRLLGQTSPDAAANYWKQYVDWQFWKPLNLRILVECLVRAGRLAEAAEILPLLKGRPEYDKAAAALRRGWAAEMRDSSP